MPENPKSKIQNPKSKIVWILFSILIVFVYFFALGALPLVGPDEPRYAQVAREMFERGDWITPTLGGFDWFEKPALLYWLQIVSYKIFGVSEFAARLGSAIFGLGTILSLWILGKSIPDSRFQIPDSKAEIAYPKFGIWNLEFANWLVLIAASSIGLLAFSRGASFDIILTFPLTASLVAFFIFDQSDENSFVKNYLPLAAFYFFIGLALLAKGLIGIVFPFAIVAFYYVLSWKFPPRKFVFSLFWGTILSLIVAAVWYLPMYQTNGWKFVDEFFIQHHFQRFTSDKYQHAQPFWFFWLVLPLMTLPWLPFFLAAIWNLFKVQSSKFKVQGSTPSSFLPIYVSPVLVFAFSWLLVPLVFFTFSGSKLPGYILPALPAALILTAESVFTFVQKSSKRKYFLQATAFSVLVVAAFCLQFVAPKFAHQDSVKGLIEAADSNNYATEKIVNLYVVSHNAEFYAPGRLVRNDDGTLKRFDDFLVLVNDLKRENESSVLILVPHSAVKGVIESPLVTARILDDNGDTAIVAAKVKN